jgi:hypothetical protein
VNFEPVRTPSVPGTAFGHAHHHALPESARLTRCPVLLVDDTLSVVLAFRDGVKIVVRPPEE